MHKLLYALAASLVAVESSPPRLMAMFGAEGPDEGKSKETTTTRAPQRRRVVNDAPPPLKWRHQPYACHDLDCDECLAGGASSIAPGQVGLYGGDYVEKAFGAAGFATTTSCDDWQALWVNGIQTCRGTYLEPVNICPLLQARQREPPVCSNCSYFYPAGEKTVFADPMKRVKRLFGGYGVLKIQAPHAVDATSSP